MHGLHGLGNMGDQGSLVLDGKANAGSHFGFEGTEYDAYLAPASVDCTHLLIFFSTLLKIEVPGMPARQTKLPQPTKARTHPFHAVEEDLCLDVVTVHVSLTYML